MAQSSPPYRLTTTKKNDEVSNDFRSIERKMRVLVAAKPLMPDIQLSNKEEVTYYVDLRGELQKLDKHIAITAEAIWQEPFGNLSAPESRRYFSRRAGDEHQKNRRTVTIYTNFARRLMRIGLEAQLYSIRLQSNYADYLNPENDQEANDLAQVKAAITGYYNTLNRWDAELVRRTGKRYFSRQRGDKELFKQLSHTFGADSTELSEHGWLQVAGQVQDELRYQFYEANRRETHQILTKLWLIVFKFVTGYGRYPILTLPFTVAVVALFTVLYGVLSKGCDFASTPWNALQTAITTLAGNTTSACGGSIGVLQTIETIIGYILLAILSALILDKLTESERFHP